MRALTADRQALTGTQAAIAAEIHQALDVHRDVATQVTFDLVMFVDVFADLQDFRFGQLIDALRRLDAGARADFHRVLRADAEDVTQCDMQRFASRDIYACNTSHFGLSSKVNPDAEKTKPTHSVTRKIGTH